jgi:DNA mismatch endonuclease, patch repair protein
MARRSPSFKGCKPTSARATAAAKGSSKKTDTTCEVRLRSALWRAGLRFRKNVATLPGKPDIVFPRARVVVFCDGDFWHGRNWDERRERLSKGSNPDYWVAKITRNMERDREYAESLEANGWKVLRFWETVIRKETEAVAGAIIDVVRARCDEGRNAAHGGGSSRRA